MIRLKTAAASAILGATVVAPLPIGAIAAKQSAAPVRRSAAYIAITNVTRQLQRQASGRAIAFGTLAATGTNTASLTTPGNVPLTITLAPKTRLVARSQTAAAQGYKTGDQVLVNGIYRNGFLGTSVAYDATAFPVPLLTRVAGKVSTSSAQSLTVALAGNKTPQFQLASPTRFFVNGKASVTAPTLTANEKVTVLAQEQTDGTFVARIVALGELNPVTAGTNATIRAAGTVGTIAGDKASFTLTLKSGKTATITIAATTRFRINGTAATTAPTLTPNEQVVVQGTQTIDAAGNVTIAAKFINVKTTSP